MTTGPERASRRNNGKKLQSDEVPWVSVAENVLAGKYLTADRSTLRSIGIGVRGIEHDTCKEAYSLIKMQLRIAYLQRLHKPG